MARRHGDYAVCGLGAVVTVDADGVVTPARAGYISVVADPARARPHRGGPRRRPADADWAAAGELARGQVDPEADIHATADYRRHLVRVLTARALAEAAATARGGMSEEPHDVRLVVNGVPRTARVPARRLLSDCLRHELRLTGTHVGCEHGVCGACTVLLDGEPVRSCLLLAVSVDGHEVTTVEGLGRPTTMHGPVQQAFRECHGLQCGFCTPGFLTTVTAYLEDHPDPTEDEAREAISGNLCRCTGYQNIVASVLRAAETHRSRATTGGPLVTTKTVRRAGAAGRGPRLVTGTARYLDDLGQDALGAAFVRSPHAHARIVDIDVDRRARGRRAGRDLHLRRPRRAPVAQPLPLLIPHPSLTAPRTGYPLARDEVNHVGEAVVMVVAADRYLAEDAAERVLVTYDVLPPVVGVDNARRADRVVHDDVPDNVAAHLLQEVGDVDTALAAAPHTLSLSLDVERSASMPMEGKGVHARWDAADGSMRVHSSTQTSTSVRAAVAARLACRWARWSASRRWSAAASV